MKELLVEALSSPLGIKVKTSDPLKLRQQLYVLRSGDPDCLCLSFVVSPSNPDDELWIVRRSDEE